ncbi:hypothetical protein MN608_05526 [Microdochium nivale]|nr:hypothetical protein MN608_05526 [Microdochium nivale]
MAEMIVWAESFCPFDAIGMPAHHIDFNPPSQDDFKHAVEKAKFVLYAARIKQSEAPALPFNENHITLAVKYFTQEDSPNVNPASQQLVLNELA